MNTLRNQTAHNNSIPDLQTWDVISSEVRGGVLYPVRGEAAAASGGPQRGLQGGAPALLLRPVLHQVPNPPGQRCGAWRQ